VDCIFSIEEILKAAAESYRKSLSSFRPWISTYPRNNVIAERNISFHAARSFCELTDGYAFMEREFRQIVDGREVSLKLDSYCASPELTCLLECKVLVDANTANEIMNDIDRLNEDTARQQVLLHVPVQPRNVHGLILVETWKSGLRDWWISTHNINIPPNLEGATERKVEAQRNGWQFKSTSVGRFEHGSPALAAGTECIWLYAIGPCMTINCDAV